MTIALPDLLLYCGALVILFLTPGPVWLAIMARALSGGFGAAWPLALGVAIGDMLWPLVAVLGISWILSVFDMFMLGMRWIACAVFLIMGVLLIRHADAKIDRDNRLTRPGAWAGFGAGLLAILGNPKAVLFYIGGRDHRRIRRDPAVREPCDRRFSGQIARPDDRPDDPETHQHRGRCAADLRRFAHPLRLTQNLVSGA